MIHASLSKTIDGMWLGLKAVQVGGGVSAREGVADRYVTITRNGEPFFRIDVLSDGPDCFAFEEVCVWRDVVVVGYGSYVHVVSLEDQTAVTIELGAYFGNLYPRADFVLLASAERLFRLEPDRSIKWKSDELGVDGVLVHDIDSGVIRGDGEWDPPGGWIEFTVSVADGKRMP